MQLHHVRRGKSDPSYFQQTSGKASAKCTAKALLEAVGLVLLLCEHPGSLVSHHPAELLLPCIFKDCWNQLGPGRGCRREDTSNPFSYREGGAQGRLCCLYVWLVIVQSGGVLSHLLLQGFIVSHGVRALSPSQTSITDCQGSSPYRVPGTPGLGLAPSLGLHSLLQQGHLASFWGSQLSVPRPGSLRAPMRLRQTFPGSGIFWASWS